jgi:hypothetical protein
MAFRIEDTGVFRGLVQFLSILLPSGSVTAANIAAAAGVEATKLEHQHREIYRQESDTTVVSEDRVVHVVKGTTGNLKTFRAGSVVANAGAATITVDLHKNGSTILTAPISLDNGDSAYDLVAGVISSEPVVADDVLEVVVVATAGGGTIGKGVFASLDVHEDVS